MKCDFAPYVFVRFRLGEKNLSSNPMLVVRKKIKMLQVFHDFKLSYIIFISYNIKKKHFNPFPYKKKWVPENRFYSHRTAEIPLQGLRSTTNTQYKTEEFFQLFCLLVFSGLFFSVIIRQDRILLMGYHFWMLGGR